MIIVSITGPSMQDALAQMRQSRRYADMFELRLDVIHRPNIAALIAASPKPTIATCKPVREGGMFEGAERERIEMLEIASVFGATYVDVELDMSPRLLQEFIRRKHETKVIVSKHLPSAEPVNIPALYRRLSASGADVVKLAFIAADAADNRHAFDFLGLARRDRQKAVAVAMGDAGEASRILYRKFGGWATYAAPESGPSAAPGQIPARQLREVYRSHVVNRYTRVFGVVGGPVRHSKGVFIHNPLFRRFGMNGVYCRFPVADLPGFMKRMASLLSGFSVTIPHKEAIVRHLHRLDAAARAIGAVNTVLIRNGRLLGTNTDAPGALDAIESVCRVAGKRVLVLGAGGAARAIAYEAKRRGAKVSVANRTLSRARALCRDLGVVMVKLGRVTPGSFDIVANATPVGMAPNDGHTPIPKRLLKGKVVFDAVYNPPITRLLREARSANARIVPGAEMYINQAILQFKLYTGKTPSPGTMRKLLEVAE